MHSFRSENPRALQRGTLAPPYSDELVTRALQVLEGRMRQNPYSCGSPKAVRDFLRLKLGALEHEAFGVVRLDSQNRVIAHGELFRVIAHGELFRGTLTQTSVYPREVVKEALACNAGAATPVSFAERCML